jgi:hypothetical protein
VQVRGHGVRATLPRGWEAVVRASPAPERPPGEVGTMSEAQATRQPSLLHAGTFALPPERGDFGSHAVDLMGPDDTFVALLEFGPEEVGTALFAEQGLPRRLDPRRFSGRALQRSLPGQAGWQHFFTEGGRPFCLYVVLGDSDDALHQVRRVEQLLATVEVDQLDLGTPPAPRSADPEIAPEEGADVDLDAELDTQAGPDEDAESGDVGRDEAGPDPSGTPEEDG